MTAAGAARPTPSPLPTRIGVGVVVLALYSLAGVVGLAHCWAHPTTVALGAGGGDSAQTTWYLRYLPWALGHGHNPLSTTVANWPYGLDLVDQTSVLVLGLVVSPVTLAFGPVVAYTVCTTGAYALSACAAYALCRRWVAWRPAAFAGGLLYGFSSYMVGQASHLNLCFVPLPPLIFLLLEDLVVGGRHRARTDGLLLAVAAIVQFFISTEILATTALFALLTLVALAIRHPDRVRGSLGRLVEGLAWGAVVGVVVLAWPVAVLLRGPQHISGSVLGFRYYFSSLASPVLPTSNQAIGVHRLVRLGNMLGGNLSEDDGYLGVPLLVLALVALLAMRGRPPHGERTRAMRVAVFMAAVAFLLSLGDRLHVGVPRYAGVGRHVPLPAVVLYHIPLFNQAFPNRYALYVTLFLAVVLAAGLEALRDRLATGPRTGSRSASRTRSAGRRSGGGGGDGRAAVLTVLVAAVVLAPLLPAWPMPGQGPVATPAYFTSHEVDAVPEGSVALAYPYPTAAEDQAQLWQAQAGLRFTLPGGYYLLPARTGGSQTSEPTLVATTLTRVLTGPAPTRTTALRRALRAELGSWHVETLLVQPVGTDPAGFFTWLTGRPADSSAGGLLEWYHQTWDDPAPQRGPVRAGPR